MTMRKKVGGIALIVIAMAMAMGVQHIVDTMGAPVFIYGVAAFAAFIVGNVWVGMVNELKAAEAEADTYAEMVARIRRKWSNPPHARPVPFHELIRERVRESFEMT